ncbi:hypothetical protein PENTCL1PPCAC_7777, partial [Pristionchus entomophagus]
DNYTFGVIRFEVDQVSTLNSDGQWSPEVKVGGVPWKVKVSKRCSHLPRSSSPWLRIELHSTNAQSTPYKIDLDAQFILVNADTSKSYAFTKKESFVRDHKKRGCYLKKWKRVSNEESGFIKDDKITVEVRILVNEMKGTKDVPLMDFTNPNEPFHDVTLVIGGEKIYVNKQYLSIHSPVFQTMFYGNFDEKNKKELKGVHREEFVEMLHAIYPSCKKITDIKYNNVSAEYLLKLGDQFQI